jgi:hypothetical protein
VRLLVPGLRAAPMTQVSDTGETNSPQAQPYAPPSINVRNTGSGRRLRARASTFGAGLLRRALECPAPLFEVGQVVLKDFLRAFENR